MLHPAWWVITGYYQISLSHDFVEQADRYTDKQNDLSVSHATFVKRQVKSFPSFFLSLSELYSM